MGEASFCRVAFSNVSLQTPHQKDAVIKKRLAAISGKHAKTWTNRAHREEQGKHQGKHGKPSTKNGKNADQKAETRQSQKTKPGNMRRAFFNRTC